MKKSISWWLLGIAGVGLGSGCSRDVQTTAQSPAQFVSTPEAEPADYEFEAPVRLQAGGDFISVESPGYACPTMADVDGDGQDDLVVGQFNQGHLLFCKNESSSGEPPIFAKPEWLMSGEARAVVPGVW